MKFMVIERFKPGKTQEVYARFQKNGRMLPEGLRYLDSWLTVDRCSCFQLMETEDVKLFEIWINNWKDLTDFENGTLPLKKQMPIKQPFRYLWQVVMQMTRSWPIRLSMAIMLSST